MNRDGIGSASAGHRQFDLLARRENAGGAGSDAMRGRA
jgi:hypothetical protein